MVLFDYTSSDEEFNMEKEEDIAMLLFMHKNKRPKHGGSLFGHELSEDEELMQTSSCSTTSLTIPCFLSMLGSIDFMHLRWKNGPAAWHRQFRGHKKNSTIIF
jgi:hypothetical protein